MIEGSAFRIYMETEEAVGDIGLVVGIQGGLNSTSSLKISQNLEAFDFGPKP